MKILCIPTAQITPLLQPGKVVYPDNEGVPFLSLLREHGVWIERDDAEKDPSFRQVIPYITVTNEVTGLRLLMTRMKKQGEARLHGKEYIGVGGHIDRQSEDEQASISCVPQAAHREIKEETGFENMLIMYKGVLCVHGEGASEVDLVHIGVVYEAATTEEKFNTEEADLHNHRWATDDDLRAAHAKAEVWTQLVMSGVLKLI
jgi:predicted NUDIX family phosphoesterase